MKRIIPPALVAILVLGGCGDGPIATHPGTIEAELIAHSTPSGAVPLIGAALLRIDGTVEVESDDARAMYLWDAGRTYAALVPAESVARVSFRLIVPTTDPIPTVAVVEVASASNVVYPPDVTFTVEVGDE